MNWYKKIASNIQLKFVYPDEFGESKVLFNIDGKDYTYVVDTDIANKIQDTAKYKPGTALDIAKKNNKLEYDSLETQLKTEIEKLNQRINDLNGSVQFGNLSWDEISKIEEEIKELETVRDFNQRQLDSHLSSL